MRTYIMERGHIFCYYSSFGTISAVRFQLEVRAYIISKGNSVKTSETSKISIHRENNEICSLPTSWQSS